MRFDAHGLEVLERLECLELLSSVKLGRVVFTERALPAIQPMNFALDGGDVVIRTRLGSRLSRALRGAVVAFEADAFDPAGLVGWSVTMIGQSSLIADPEEISRLSRLPALPPPPGPGGDLIRISGRYLSGTRIGTAPTSRVVLNHGSPNGQAPL
ncbi:MAG: pyridoxamine 5'-phosphate oxidase family protein [Streptosporangiaceae bacterium]